MTKTQNQIKIFSLIDLWIQKDIALFIHKWNLCGFFFPLVLFFPNILLLTLIRCLGDEGLSGF